jgi:hypothetical protein
LAECGELCFDHWRRRSAVQKADRRRRLLRARRERPCDSCTAES